MQRWPTLGVLVLAGVFAALVGVERAEVPPEPATMSPELAAEATVTRTLARARAAELARPTATPYPTPAAVPATARTREQILAGLPMGAGKNRCRSAEVKLMRDGDWWRLTGQGPTSVEGPDDWIWVAACWGDDFEPAYCCRLRGLTYTWEASRWPALGPPGSGGGGDFESAYEPPVWRDLPDYSAAARR